MKVKTIEIEGVEFYTFEASYFENETVAEASGYYWNDEIGLWTKEIIDNTTTVF